MRPRLLAPGVCAIVLSMAFTAAARSDTELICQEQPAPPGPNLTHARSLVPRPAVPSALDFESYAPAPIPVGASMLLGTWTPLQIAPSSYVPEARHSTSVVYDPSRQRFLTHGGAYTFEVYHNYYNETYGDVIAFPTDSTMPAVELSPTGTNPSPRQNHSVVLDRARDRLIVFGGRDFQFNNEVWTFDLATNQWQQPTVVGTPPSPRMGHTAILDPLRDRMIVFGGRCIASYVDSTDKEVWALSLSEPMTWTQLTPLVPAPGRRYFHSAIYDPVHDQMVIFGGRETSIVYDDLWALSLSGSPAWSPLYASDIPPGGRYGHSAVYDSKRHRMLIFGGKNQPAGSADSFNDTWSLALDGTPSWSGVSTPAGAPSPRYWAGAVYDSVRDEMDVMWGTSGYCAYGLRSDGWRFKFDDTNTAANLTLVAVEAAPDRVRLLWQAPDTRATSYTVQRRDSGSDWMSLGVISNLGDGHLEFVDRTVAAGVRYAYRLGQDGVDGTTYSNETWIDVPARFSLRLDPPRPNPGGRDVSVVFTLPSAAPATLEMIDVAGRRVMSREVGSLGAGAHSLRLGEFGAAPGVYLVRLSQRDRVLTAHAVIVR